MKTFLVLLIFIPALVSASTLKRASKIYAIGKLDEAPLFVQITDIQREGGGSFVSNAKIEDPSGKIVMKEKVVVKEGSLVSQFVEQLQSNEAWNLTVVENGVYFESFKIVGESRQKLGEGRTEKVESFINGPLIETFIAKNWDKLLSAETVTSAFSVLELERTVDFKFQMIKEAQRADKRVIIVKMQPANFFVSVLVDPIIIEFDQATKKLVYFKGRTPLKVLKSGDWKPLDAEILYD